MSVRCFHCAEIIPANFSAPVVFDAEPRATCCYGCQAVMQSIVDAGLDDYYRFRTEVALLGVIPEALEKQLDALAVYDEPEFVEQLVVRKPSGGNSSLAEIVLSVEGMRCGACVWLLERSVAALTGVAQASFNYSTGRAVVRFNVNDIALSSILHRIQSVGYKAIPFDALKQEQGLIAESRLQMQRLFVAGIAMMQVMMYALPHYLSETGEIDYAHIQLLRWASMVLTTPVILFSAKPFFAGALRSFKSHRVGMDVPVVVGILAAYSASVWNTVKGGGETYFDSVSMFVFLLLLARYLEWFVRCRAVRSIDDVALHAPETARLFVTEPDGVSDYRIVPALRLAVGDVIRVDSGETVPVDGTVLGLGSSIDCSVLTGESLPVHVSSDEAVPSGAQVIGAPIRLRVTEVQNYSTLSLIGKLVERGAADKPHVVKLADRVAGYFVAGLLGFAALVYVSWLLIDPDQAVAIAITVLVVSCPCALSLATPAALAASTSLLLESRLLITRGHALEAAAKITDVVLDKTGTLTQGTPEIVDFAVAEGQDPDRILSLAATLEAGSAHPFAKAIRALAPVDKNTDVLEHAIGAGVAAALSDGSAVRLGSAAWCGLDKSSLKAFESAYPKPEGVFSDVYLVAVPTSTKERTGSGVYAANVMARFSMADRLRSDALETIEHLKENGLTVHLLSGDQTDVVANVAQSLGISSWTARATPIDKKNYVTALQKQRARVLMVGDGINDAPVLAAADVSMAIGNATSLARTSADTISLTNGLSALPLLLLQAQRTARVVKQNLFWALGYNLLAIPAAALGYVSPWLAAIGMACSSLIVAGNAYRLWVQTPTSAFPVKPAYPKNQSRAVLWNH